MKTFMGVRHLISNENYMFSFDVQDGFYALGVAPSDRYCFTVNIRGELYRLRRWPGARIIPYVDDFLLFDSSEPEALELHQRVADLLDVLRLQRIPTKGLWDPVHNGQHPGVDIDTATGHFMPSRSGYGWGGAVLNDHLEARAFGRPGDERQHITCKELKAVRLAVESILPRTGLS
eukprot:jgi/Tetstr1/449370/TSEL_003881.t1